MKREEAKEFIRRNIASLYEMEGDVQITIEELNTIDNILMEVYRRNIPSGRTCVPMEESQRKKISDARLGVPLSDATKERIRQDSQRINVYQYNLEGDELIAVWKSTREAARRKQQVVLYGDTSHLEKMMCVSLCESRRLSGMSNLLKLQDNIILRLYIYFSVFGASLLMFL